MRPGRIRSAGSENEPNDYRRGFVNGLFTAFFGLFSLAAAFRLIEWANAHDVVQEVYLSFTSPVLSVADLLTIAVVVLLIVFLIKAPRLLRGGA